MATFQRERVAALRDQTAAARVNNTHFTPFGMQHGAWFAMSSIPLIPAIVVGVAFVAFSVAHVSYMSQLLAGGLIFVVISTFGTIALYLKARYAVMVILGTVAVLFTVISLTMGVEHALWLLAS